MEGLLPEYSVLGNVRQPTGSRIPTAAPSNAYPSSDGGWILVAANSDPLFARLAKVIGKPQLAEDERFKGNQKRVQNVEALDVEIAAWTRGHTAAEADRILSEADIPCTQVYTAKEIAEDPQFRERGMVQEVEDPLFGRVLHTGVVPYMPECGSGIRWTGPRIGQHTDEVLRDWLGLGAGEIESLRREGVV